MKRTVLSRECAVPWGLGPAVGLLGGLAFARRLDQPRQLRWRDEIRQALSASRGEVNAALLAALVQARYEDLYAHRPRFRQHALRSHLEGYILPGLALY